MSKNLVADAIADAKEFKKLAIEHARLSLLESVSPQIKAILEAKLAEDADEDDEEKPEGEEMETKPADEALNALMEKLKAEDPAKYEVVSAVLAEKKKAEAEPEEEKEEKEDEEATEETDETLDIDAALAEIENSQVKTEAEEAPAEKETEETPAETEDDNNDSGDNDEEIDEDYISRIMAEVEEADDDEEEEAPAEKVDESFVDIPEIKAVLASIKAFPASVKKAWDDKYSPKAVQANMDAGKPVGVLAGNASVKEAPKDEKDEETVETTEQLLELKSELFEMNLLLAKLMYQNKLLLSENFSDQQKAKIITVFDKVKTVNEAKLIFETLDVKNTKKTVNKTPISETLGFKRIGAKDVINESKTPAYNTQDPFVQKMMERAGIKVTK